jgi:hypothetical protein
MRTKIAIGLMCVTAVLAWTGMAVAQTAPPAPKVQLPSGETVWDLNGDWDALVENYGPYERFGTHTNTYRITQTGNTFDATRLKDNPPPSTGRAGSPSLKGELEKNGFKYIYLIDSGGNSLTSKGQISEDGKKILIDEGRVARVTLTRPDEPDKLKALLLRPAGWKADWSLPGGMIKGESEFIFVVRGEKVVAKIQNITLPTTCERDVTVTSDIVKFDGCYDSDITLRFDSNDQDYPFKGKSARNYDYKLRAK